MARSLHTVPRAGGLGPAAVIAVLLAVLTALLNSPAHGSTYLTYGAAPTSGAAQTGSEPYADDGHSAVRNTLVRSQRDTPGERLSPSATATLTSYCGAHSPPSCARTPLLAANPPASLRPADRHQGRAPPPAPGT
ncbi:hypothetical protein [Streptomyces sp. TRM70350]|uniref:hypothetical protein n=1 Tax=Streptomyces sp. TRM70350 TaxID=2856165 RepID=UPI001C439C40|nr:hypothetical protein [Streptomyces sp. TRM70350]MBV7699500.1 hypothetical protein [Streptomyces sp. TRM70350]